MQPFIILALPRSRTAWLSRFLTYGETVCGHEELRHMRSLDDIATWWTQPQIGTVETAVTPYWRLFDRFIPNVKVVTIRRDVNECVDSYMRLKNVGIGKDVLRDAFARMDRKLDQIEARIPGVMSVKFEDLEREHVCAELFEHCTPYKHDREHWQSLCDVNIQCDMYAMARLVNAFRPALEKLGTIAKQQTLAAMALRPAIAPDGIELQCEDFDTWIRDAQPLFDEHLIHVGEAPGDWQRKNIPLMKSLYDAGAMQIMTARSNGRMFGYLMTLITPSLTSQNLTSAVNTTFFSSGEFKGLGMKMQRAAIRSLKQRGVGEMFFEAGARGSGPKLGTMYRRLGAVDHGQTFRLDMAGL